MLKTFDFQKKNHLDLERFLLPKSKGTELIKKVTMSKHEKNGWHIKQNSSLFILGTCNHFSHDPVFNFSFAPELKVKKKETGATS